MSNWQLGPEHPDYGKPLEPLTGPHRTWRVGEERPCERPKCVRTFTITRLNPDQRYCCFGCAAEAQP